MNTDKRNFIIRCIVFISIILLLLLFSSLIRCKGSAEIIFLPVTEADSIIVRSEGEVIMIDTGTKEDEKLVISKLVEMNIEKIDVLLLTHPDADHIGNAVNVMREVSIGKIIMPEVKKESKLEKELYEEIDRQGISLEVMQNSKLDLTVGDCSIQLLQGLKKNYSQINDYSIVTLLKCGEINAFFGADIEENRIKELLSMQLPRCEIMKIPHHGKDEKHSSQLIEKLQPQLSVVTSMSAEQGVKDAMNDIGSDVVYTSHQGVIVSIHDNEWYWKEMDKWLR